MRKIIVILLALALAAAFAVPALADTSTVDIRVTTKDVKIYEEKDTDSNVLGKIKKGKDVLIDVPGSKWCGVLVEDADGDGQSVGWILTKYLKCKHNWTDWEVEREATCSKKGLRTRYCTRCGEEQEKEIAKLDHTFGKWTVEKKATCAKKGLRVRTCKVCGHEEEEEYTEPHTFGDWEVTEEPTCTEKGERVRTCEVCGHEETKAIDMLPHDYKWVVLESATDHSSGTRAQVCQVCGKTEKAVSYDPEGTLRRNDRSSEVYELQEQLVEQGYLNVGGADGIFGGGTEKALMKFQNDQGLKADGVAWPQTRQRLKHDFGPWITVKPLTRTAPGERVRTCKECGYEQHETIEMGEVIERGARGENVRALQQILKQVGYDAGNADGIYGKKLDSAFTAFEKARDMTFEAGKVRPADVDALVSAWLEAGAAPRTEGGMDSPVDLALSVTPGTDETADGDATTYSWKLTNLGTEKCIFNALLLTYGNDPDFTRDDMVMVIDGKELKSGTGNSASGSFTVADAWGEGSLNFAALAIHEKTGDRWLSNVVTFEAAEAPADDAPKTVAPIAVSLNVNALPDGEYHVAFDRGDIASVTSGIYMNAVHVFTRDDYAAADIESLAPGDTLVVEGQSYEVKTVRDAEGYVEVNGGNGAMDGAGHTLSPSEGFDTYRIVLDDDFPTYTDHGATTLMVDPSAKFIDGWDIEQGDVITDYLGLVNAIATSPNDYFDPFNTTLTVKNGKVVELHRYYVP